MTTASSAKKVITISALLAFHEAWRSFISDTKSALLTVSLPASVSSTHERQKLLGPATLPENLWHLPQLPPPATPPYMNAPTQFRIRRREQRLC
jgi:hypothetical protein